MARFRFNLLGMIIIMLILSNHDVRGRRGRGRGRSKSKVISPFLTYYSLIFNEFRRISAILTTFADFLFRLIYSNDRPPSLLFFRCKLVYRSQANIETQNRINITTTTT